MPSSPPQSEYRVIYADPPWSFATYSDKGKGRSAQAHYDCLGMDDLCKIPVREWAARNCALFLWTTDPLLPQALKLIEAWGFTYKTVGFYWAKLNRAYSAEPTPPKSATKAEGYEGGSAPGKRFAEKDFFTGLGFWTRANVEQCLLATRGKPKREAKDVRRLVIAPRREHSRKPEEVYGRIERLLGGPYLELFARGTRPGWDSWGDQSGLFDTGPVETRRFPSDLASGLTAPGLGD